MTISRWVLVLLLLSASAPAAATGLYELTGSHGSVLPFAGRVTAQDTSVVYFNPALLTRVRSGVGFSMFAMGQLLDLGYRPRPEGSDISGAIYQARLRLDDGTTERLSYRPLATADLRTTRGSSDPDAFGAFVSLGMVQHFIPDILALGVHATVPVTEFQAQTSFFPDQREQFFSNSLHFELLEDRARVTMLSLALAWQPLDWLSVGAGLSMTTRSQVTSQVYVADVSYQETAEINAELAIKMAFVPHLSLAFEPVNDLLLTTSLHFPYQSDVDGRSELQMWNYPYEDDKDSLEQLFAFSFGYEPLRATLGLSWERSLHSGLGLSLSTWARYARWSKYVNRHGERPLDDWQDTVSGNVAGQLRINDHSFGLEVGFVPTPVPDQRGQDNYVDNHRLVGAAGWSVPLTFGSRTVQVGLQAQAHYLLPREHVKDDLSANPVFDEFPDNSVDLDSGQLISAATGLQTNNPGYPGFNHKGWLLGGALTLKSAF